MRVRDEKDIAGCAIAGIMSEAGRRYCGENVVRSVAVMKERSNGLGGGFAAYGIYPEYAGKYAFHLMLDHAQAHEAARDYLVLNCTIAHEETIPTRPTEAIGSSPILHRYFVEPRPQLRERYYDETEEDIIVRAAMHINRSIDGAFVMSCGKNMGVFKGVGQPEDIAHFFRLEEYEAYLWLAHGRFPTNTTGWWGGSHPFGLLDWSVVHNGEVSSYGINRRYLQNFGYYCALRTDTEVICYLLDLLIRKHALPVDLACQVLAPPFWSQIARMAPAEQELARALRVVYGGALLNGPFSIVVGHSGGLIALNDRTKLRPMTAARKGEMLYIASEEAAIWEVCDSPDRLWHAQAGVPIIGALQEKSLAQVARTA